MSSRVVGPTRVALCAVMLACMVLMACRGDSTGPDHGMKESAIRFTYASSVAGSGLFYAHGEADIGAGELPDTGFVVAATDSSGAMVILGLQGRLSVDAAIILMLIVDGGQPTTIHVDTACVAAGTCRAAPPIAAFTLDHTQQNVAGCGLFTSTITLTAVSADRVRGTVSGTDGRCTDGSTQQEGDFTMTKGSFDIALQRVGDVADMPDVMQSLGVAERRVIRRHLEALLGRPR